MSVLNIRHQTTYRHTAPAVATWQAVHLMPRDEPGQECIAFDLDITPAASDISRRTDYFGNATHLFSLRTPHTSLEICATSTVRRREIQLPMPALTPTIEAAQSALEALIENGSYTLEQYRHASRYVPLLAGAREVIEDLDTGETPALEWMTRLGERFASDFTFDPHATSISTPVEQVLQERRGVCQDFAHLFICCARLYGLPAAYVSGYILTTPPPGQPRLRGADAMHAWVSLYVPGTGWVDYDPTNSVFAGTGHVVVARGRDYNDVSPIHGIFSGGGQHTLYLGVTVEPEEASL
jgi:transglutaminase-like putative cysteine protease